MAIPRPGWPEANAVVKPTANVCPASDRFRRYARRESGVHFAKRILIQEIVADDQPFVLGTKREVMRSVGRSTRHKPLASRPAAPPMNAISSKRARKEAPGKRKSAKTRARAGARALPPSSSPVQARSNNSTSASLIPVSSTARSSEMAAPSPSSSLFPFSVTLPRATCT